MRFSFLTAFLAVSWALVACGGSPANDGTSASASTLNKNCITSTDCRAGEVCIASPCVPGTKSCPSSCQVSHGNDPGKGPVSPGKGGPPSSGTCTNDADCPAGEACIVPPCVPGATNCSPSCQAKSTAGTGGGPVSPSKSNPPGDNTCTTNADCPANEACIASPCVPGTKSCPSFCEAVPVNPPRNAD